MAAAALAPREPPSHVAGNHAEPFEQRVVTPQEVPNEPKADGPALMLSAHS
jgi:hypothetical protein